MGDVLGLGLSHYPPLSGKDEDMAQILRWTLDDPDIPEHEKNPEQWPQLMQEEWADDAGRTAAADHRAALVEGFENTRKALDEFQPDALIIWGDDQYENFREDIIPAYAVLAYEDMDIQPWRHAQESSAMSDKPNTWDETGDYTIRLHGRPDIGKYLVTRLLERDFDAGYAYTRLHHPGLPHAFLNAVLYLDYHRSGFDYPVIPFPINCYGRRVISYQGIFSRFGVKRELDPPSVRPARLIDLGAAVADIVTESPWRIALVASSSWSHAFLTDSTWRLRPDTPADQKFYRALVEGDEETWRKATLHDIEAAGQQELLNWFPLIGAMHKLGRNVPTWHDFVQTDVFNSNKVFATYTT